MIGVVATAGAVLVVTAATDGLGEAIDGAASWGDASTLADHFARHGGEFGAADEADYASQANEFYNNSGNPGIQVKYDFYKNQTRVYDPATNSFGSYNYNGTTATFYKPTGGQGYFNRQPGSLIP
jgi:pyocin large subunit-like protein